MASFFVVENLSFTSTFSTIITYIVILLSLNQQFRNDFLSFIVSNHCFVCFCTHRLSTMAVASLGSGSSYSRQMLSFRSSIIALLLFSAASAGIYLLSIGEMKLQASLVFLFNQENKI